MEVGGGGSGREVWNKGGMPAARAVPVRRWCITRKPGKGDRWKEAEVELKVAEERMWKKGGGRMEVKRNGGRGKRNGGKWRKEGKEK